MLAQSYAYNGHGDALYRVRRPRFHEHSSHIAEFDRFPMDNLVNSVADGGHEFGAASRRVVFLCDYTTT